VSDSTTFDTLLGASVLALLSSVAYAAVKGRPSAPDGFLGMAAESMRDPTTWGPGHMVNGRWRLGRRLGRGGMGVVFEAIDTRNNMEVALKFPLSIEVWPAIEEEFGLTAQAGPVAPQVYALGHDFATSLPFVVMERLRGTTLHNLRGRIEPFQVITELKRALSGIGEMHERGIIHRDIKPENIFETTDGKVKLLDFGLAGKRGTASYVGFGTEGFGPPEQIPDPSRSQVIRRHVTAMPAADIYATGATMQSMLTDRPDLMAACAPSLDVDMLPRRSKEVSEIVTKAMQCYPDERWQSAYAMRDAMDRVLREAYEKAGLPYYG